MVASVLGASVLALYVTDNFLGHAVAGLLPRTDAVVHYNNVLEYNYDKAPGEQAAVS